MELEYVNTQEFKEIGLNGSPPCIAADESPDIHRIISCPQIRQLAVAICPFPIEAILRDIATAPGWAPAIRLVIAGERHRPAGIDQLPDATKRISQEVPHPGCAAQ